MYATPGNLSAVTSAAPPGTMSTRLPDVIEVPTNSTATGVRLPFRSSWVPRGLGTLAQRRDGRTYYYRPEATGSLRLCRLRRWCFDRELFPDLSRASVLTALRIEGFRMVFPVARIVE